LAHLAEGRGIGAFFGVRLDHPRQQLFLRVLSGGVPDQPLLFSQLLIQQ
jgi:hypothetical protein